MRGSQVWGSLGCACPVHGGGVLGVTFRRPCAVEDARAALSAACLSVCIHLFSLWQGPPSPLSPEDVRLLVKVRASNHGHASGKR